MWDDSAEIPPTHGGSRLLSESSLNSPPGPNDADLSLSELSIDPTPKPKSGRIRKPPKFSLLAPREDTETFEEENAEHEERVDTDVNGRAITDEEVEEDKQTRQVSLRTREEKLQHDLIVLRKLNATFGVYNEALKEAKTQTEVREHTCGSAIY
jgi:hypothetical protein